MLLAPGHVAAQALIVSGGTSTNITSGTNSYNGIIVGNQDSSNSLTISGGSTVINTSTNFIGYGTGAGNPQSNSELVTGSGSLLSNSSDLYLGSMNLTNSSATSGTNSGNSLTISNAGTVTDANGYVGFLYFTSAGSIRVASNSVLVTGSGSLWSNSAGLYLGYCTSIGGGGTPTASSLTISNGGTVIDSTGILCYSTIINRAISGSSVLVTGSNSLWSNSSALLLSDAPGIGGTASGTLTLANGGSVAATSLSLSASFKNSSGTLNIGSPGGSDTAGVLLLGSSTITSSSMAASIINFNQIDTFILSNAVSGTNVTLNQLGSGTTILTANNSSGGKTTVTNGTLLAENISGSAVGTGTLTVTNAGTLGGTGIIGGAVTIANGGHLVPGVNGVGALTLTKGLTLTNGATTTFLIIDTNNYTSLNIQGGTVSYGGTLQLNLTSFVPSAGDTLALFSTWGGGATNTNDFSNVLAIGNNFTFTDASGIWTGTDANGVSYQFSAPTGNLSVLAVPEPSSSVFLGVSLGILTLVIAWRRRSSLKRES